MLGKPILLAAGVMVLATQAFAQPADEAARLKAAAERMEHYFYYSRSPLTFRALTGMGNPPLTVAERENGRDRWWNISEADRTGIHLLFPDMDVSQKYFYPNFERCRVEAPLQMLRDRIAKLGPKHPYVAHWITVQRDVLSACRPVGEQMVALMPPMTTTDPAIARLQTQDRAYQQATFAFYAGRSDEALAGYGAIAAGKASPNRPWAAYMQVAIRAGSGKARYYRYTGGMVPPEQSLQEIHALLADPSMEPVHGIASGLIGWLGSRSDDETVRQAQVKEALAALKLSKHRIETDAQARQRFLAALHDINFLHGQFEDKAWWLNDTAPAEYKASNAIADEARQDRMAAWLLFAPNPYLNTAWAAVPGNPVPGAQDLRGYLGKWDRNDPKDPWNYTDPRIGIDALRARVDKEMARVRAGEDEQAIAALGFDYYHLIRRLLMDADPDTRSAREEEALERLKAFPFRGYVHHTVLDRSVQYLITRGRLDMARRLRDELRLDSTDRKNGQMDGHYVSTDYLILLAENEDRLVLAVAGRYIYPTELLNHLSIKTLWRLAHRSELARGARALFARTAWTRTYAQGQTIDWRDDQLMRILNPEMVAAWRSPLGRDVRPDDRLVLTDVLKSPALNLVMEGFARMPVTKPNEREPGLTGMDHYNHNDNNWWCAWDRDRHAEALDSALSAHFGGDNMVALLKPAIRGSFVFRNIDRRELAALSRIDCAPKLLSLRTIAWVKNTGMGQSREGQDEALANAVLATRWSCNRGVDHVDYSRRAFHLLHTRFADTQAAARTKYWFH